MKKEQKSLIAQWMAAWATNDESTKRRIDVHLKATGLWAYEAGSGLPTVGSWYNGPIEPGMRFFWNPNANNERCQVTRITTGGDELMVWTVSLDKPKNDEAYNEESYFRSMVAPSK